MKTLEVHLSPADFAVLTDRRLDEAVCVVFDVFRATSCMVTALANGAEAVIPVADIAEALALRQEHPDVLLAGERNGLRIPAALSGGTEFEFGNSPREFTAERVRGRTIVTTTTNGTRALRACAHAGAVLVASFLNLQATADYLRKLNPAALLIVCSGTFEQAAYEDTLGAGALAHLLDAAVPRDGVSDAALMARRIFECAGDRVSDAASQSRNGRRLLGIPELRDDVAFCLRRDVCGFAAGLQKDGRVRRL